MKSLRLVLILLAACALTGRPKTAQAAAGCKAQMNNKAVTDSLVAAINAGDFTAFTSCIADGIKVMEPGRPFNGKKKVLVWAKDEIFNTKGKLNVAGQVEASGVSVRCGRFQTSGFGFKVKYKFYAKAGKVYKWDLVYWKSSKCTL